MKENIFDKSYTLSSYHVNMHGNLTLPMLINFAIEVAGEHASRNGFGFESIMTLQKTWVLSRLKIRMDDYPKYMETFTVRTWVRTVERIFTERNFEFFGADGRKLGGAITSWAAIDLRTRRPTSVEDIPRKIELISDKFALNESIEKLPDVQPTQLTEPVTVRFHALDLNKHVTTVKYIEWILDGYNFDFLSSHVATMLEVQFQKETFIGQQIQVGNQETADNVLLHSVLRPSDKAEVCRARITWKTL